MPYENTQIAHNLNIKIWSQITGLKPPKIAHETKNWIFSKSMISIHQSNHAKRNIKLMLVRPWNRFRASCDVPEMMTKNLFFALPKHASAGITAETRSGRANIEIFAIISETLQVVLKCFQGRTNIGLMFLFPWLYWCIDILDFEKIDFWAHARFWGVPSPWEGWFFALATLASVGRKFSKIVVWKKNLKNL